MYSIGNIVNNIVITLVTRLGDYFVMYKIPNHYSYI